MGQLSDEVRAAAQGALSIVNRGSEPPLDVADLTTLLLKPDPGSARGARVQRLLATDQAPVLQDLVLGGLCSFAALAAAMRAYDVVDTAAAMWVGGLASDEAAE